MKQFKKRTIALVLASVVTVVGAFGAENYKNSLMSLKFEGGSNGTVSMTVLTKRNYEQSITPVKKDATTYVIMLPETNSQMPSSPELAGDVESVNVRTMPYTSGSKGYTKITIKTAPNAMLTASKALYIPEKKSEDELPTSQPIQPIPPREDYQSTSPVIPSQNEVQTRNPAPIRSASGVNQTTPIDIKQSVRQFEPSPAREESMAENAQKQVTEPVQENSNSFEVMLLIMGVLFVIVTSVFIYLKGKDKMAEVIGEQVDFSDDEPKKDKKKEPDKKQIRNTIRKLDKMYSKPNKMPVESLQFTSPAPIPQAPIQPEVESQPVDDTLVVDLDELFQEKTKTTPTEPQTIEEEDNSALEDFLNGFSFLDKTEDTQKDENKAFDEELYNKFINDENLKFSKSDIEKIEKLLNTEISDDTMKNISQFAVTNPIENRPTSRERLENFVTSYTINQDITFSKDDVNALYKLINVELDNDFITDLRTNPNRIQEMRQEIEKQKSKPHKASELLTLNVKDMLPDLSEALKKQGSRKIESEVKPQVVYYSEGYDVSTLSLKDELPDLSVEINNDVAYEARPSDEVELVDSSYEVAKMSVGDEIPDLDDAFNHPEKYEKPEEVVKVDEEALLRNITNVSFKPFYDGNEKDELENDFNNEDAPTVSDMQDEFSQFGDNFEIVDDSEAELGQNNTTQADDFETLFDNNYVDFDKKLEDVQELHEEAETPEVKPIETTSALPKLEKKIAKPTKNRSDKANALIQKIEEKKAERKLEKQKPQVEKIETKVKEKSEDNNVGEIKNLIIDNEIFEIVTKTDFSGKLGCYLVKNSSGYQFIGFVGEKLLKIKHYEHLKDERMRIRISEKLPNGVIRYIVRIGSHKFILNVSADNMEYVMDLC